MVVLIRYWTQRRGHNAGLAVSVHRGLPGSRGARLLGWSIPACAFSTGPCLSCCRLTTHHPTSLCPSFCLLCCLPPHFALQSSQALQWAQTSFLRKPTGFERPHMLRVWGNQRFPFGMDENIWEAKNGLNNPIIIIPPTPPLPHIQPHSGRRKTQKIQWRAQGQGEEKTAEAGEGRWEAGNEARKPQAHTAAMTYCELGQVTAAYKRISSSEHGQREDFCL